MLQAKVPIPLDTGLGDGLVDGFFEVGHAVTVMAEPAAKLQGGVAWANV